MVQSMKRELETWAKEYPSAYINMEEFAKSPRAKFVTHELPSMLKAALPELQKGFQVEGSAGQSQWTHTPWVAVIDPAVTTTVQEGYYVVYLLSADGKQLYLSLNQGCTELMKAIGIPATRSELGRRAALMRTRVTSKSGRFMPSMINLGSKLWRAQLYEAGEVLSRTYDTTSLPSDAELTRDLEEAVRLYRALRANGGWAADDDMVREAHDDGAGQSLKEAKRYRLHRSIERQAGNARKVKSAQGYRCKGCEKKMDEVYGSLASKVIHAHHLKPLASLENDAEIELDAHKDFAVLCPNCHAVIHKLDDVSDLNTLRSLIASAPKLPT